MGVSRVGTTTVSILGEAVVGIGGEWSPHPSPLPEGEGVVPWCGGYTRSAVSSLSLRERVGVRGPSPTKPKPTSHAQRPTTQVPDTPQIFIFLNGL